MLQIADRDRMHIKLIDTKSVFLSKDYPADATPLYIMLPSRRSPEPQPLANYDAYSEHLKSHGHTLTVSDPCLFSKAIANRRRVYIWIYVDDTLIAADDLRDIKEFKDVVRKRFEVTVNEEANHHLGVNFERYEDWPPKLTQSKLLGNIFSEHPEALYRTSAFVTLFLSALIDRQTTMLSQVTAAG